MQIFPQRQFFQLGLNTISLNSRKPLTRNFEILHLQC